MAYAVLTRDEADAQAYASALAPLGLEVVAAPVTKTAPPADPDALRRALAAGGFDAIMVASPRAAHQLAQARDAEWVELPAVWAVGEATRRALAIARIQSTHPPGARDGASLARALVATTPGRVLAPRAEEGMTDGVAILRAGGVEVVEVIAYRTLPLAADDPRLARGLAMVIAGDAAACVAFSPSQVRALAAAVIARGAEIGAIRTVWAAIGETTAAALREVGVARVVVAAMPSPEGIAAALAAQMRVSA